MNKEFFKLAEAEYDKADAILTEYIKILKIGMSIGSEERDMVGALEMIQSQMRCLLVFLEEVNNDRSH